MFSAKSNHWKVAITIASLLIGSAPAWSAAPLCQSIFADSAKVALSAAQKRLSQARTEYYRLSSGEIITLQIVPPADPKKETLFLLPGIFRALTALSLQDEPRAQQLVEQGYGLVLMNLSTQPYSIMELNEGEKPAYKDHIEDYVREANTAIVILEKEHGIKNIVPISLSFSSVISVSLEGFSTIIETAPLTSTAADKPDLDKAIQNLNMISSMNAFNPFFDKNYTRNNLDKAYQGKWQTYVAEDPTGHIRNHQPTEEQKQQIISSYVGMTRAVEYFKWPEARTLPSETRRIFVLARNESAQLLKDQVRVFRDVFKTQPQTVMFMIEESGHVIPKDQPAAYAKAISMGLSPDMKGFAGIVVLTPSTGKITKYSGAEVETYLRSLEK